MNKFEKQIEVRWADADANGHVRHSAYYDYGAHARIRFFEKEGFGASFMSEIGIGPIIFKEECSFIKELIIDDTIRINVLKGKLNEDASKWVLHHEIFNSKGQKSAHISLKGAWLDLKARKLTVPPIEFAKAFHSLHEGGEYVYKKSK